MELEKLQTDKEETEKEIKELYIIADRLENLKDKSNNSLIVEKLNQFIKELDKEIEYSEFYLQEIDNSIEFECMKE
jgi:hypothetical protein